MGASALGWDLIVVDAVHREETRIVEAAIDSRHHDES